MSTQPEPIQTAPVVEKPKKKKRVFMWFFLAVQALFIIWIIAGANSGSNAEECAKQVTEYFTQADCEAARGAGTAIGVGLVLVLWAITDFILVLVWAVVKLARR